MHTQQASLTMSVTYDVVRLESGGYQGRIFVDDALVEDFDAGITPAVRTLEATSHDVAERMAEAIKQRLLTNSL